MTDDHPACPTTRRIEPGLTRRLSMGMGTLTLAGAAFFGVAAPDSSTDAATWTSSAVDAADL